MMLRRIIMEPATNKPSRDRSADHINMRALHLRLPAPVYTKLIKALSRMEVKPSLNQYVCLILSDYLNKKIKLEIDDVS